MGTTGNVFAVAGRLDDPAHKLAFGSVEEAIRTPVEQSDEKLYIANQAITQEQVLARQQELARGMDGPARATPRCQCEIAGATVRQLPSRVLPRPAPQVSS